MTRRAKPSVEVVPLDVLVHDPDNARVRDDVAKAALRASVETFGAGRSVVADADGVILAGNGTLEAARAAGITEALVVDADGGQVVVVRRKDLSGLRGKAYAIADNRASELSRWDEPKLADALGALAADADLAQALAPMGFEDIEFPVATTIAIVEDQAQDQPPPTIPIAQVGDVWVLGKHRIRCGDSTDPACYPGDEPCAMTFTDPPYGVAYRDTGSLGWGPEKLAKRKAGTLVPRFDAIPNDDLDEDGLFRFLVACFKAQRLRPDAAQYVCHPSLRAHVFREALFETGYQIRSEIIWAKTRPAFNFSQYKYKHEPIYYAVPIKGTVAWYGDDSQNTLWEIASESGSVYEHPTQKPVGLAAKAIVNSSRPGDVVLDPFLGSGSTLIAAEQLGRTCYGIEIDPRYVDVVVRRWEALTGQRAVQHSEVGRK